MAFPQTHSDGEVWNGAAVTDLESRVKTYVDLSAGGVTVAVSGTTQTQRPVIDFEPDSSLSINATDDATNGRTQINVSAAGIQSQVTSNSAALTNSVLGVARFVSGAWQARPSCVICLWVGPAQPPSGTGQQVNDLYVTGS